jgi:hypothetical protein
MFVFTMPYSVIAVDDAPFVFGEEACAGYANSALQCGRRGRSRILNRA